MRVLRVGLFSEIDRPVRNGVVASVDALAAGLHAREVDVTLRVPRCGEVRDDDRPYVRPLRSIALPTRTGYRLILPFDRTDRSRTIVHAHSAFVSGELALRAARATRAPLVFTYHTRLEAYAHYAPVDARIARRVLRARTRTFANAASLVIVPTAFVRDDLRAIGVSSPIEIVPTSIDAARFAFARREPAMRSRLGAPGGEPLVLWAGRLAPEKSVPLALEAFAQLRVEGARLAIVGAGPQRAALGRLADRLGIADRIVFAGSLEPALMPEVYRAADVLLFTSESETQGLVLVEARAAGLPIVAVEHPVTREVLADAGLIAPRDPATLARRLSEALVNAPGSTATGETAAPVDFVDTLIRLYRHLLDRGR